MEISLDGVLRSPLAGNVEVGKLHVGNDYLSRVERGWSGCGSPERLHLDVAVVLKIRVLDSEGGTTCVRGRINADPCALDIGILDINVVSEVIVEPHAK